MSVSVTSKEELELAIEKAYASFHKELRERGCPSDGYDFVYGGGAKTQSNAENRLSAHMNNYSDIYNRQLETKQMRITGSMILQIKGLVEACGINETDAAVLAETMAVEIIRKTHGDSALWNYNKAGAQVVCKKGSPFEPSSFCICWLASTSQSPKVSRSL